ncbi:hypothetical protein CAEBREN_06079 [Caenorhabditis brenneri]|uniref:Uncharacterized protein n=1 Tax=Caenorhabditis brenneri TaxID=135651 RepID=G0N1Z8_CAEBE|nr:hypothetical protein CAEBREN_06079 [Caenorhabditis brenneri]
MEQRNNGFQTAELETELRPVLSKTNPESLKNLAFKKYVYVALKSVEIRRAFVELLLYEDLSPQEKDFVFDHPVLRAAVLQGMLNYSRGPRPVLNIVATKKRNYFDNNPTEYTFTGLRSFVEFDSYGMDISFSVKKPETENS